MVGSRIKWFVALILAVSASSAASSAEVYFPYPNETGVVLKTGWDSFLGTKAPGVCIVADTTQDSGEIRNVAYSEVSDASSLIDSYSVSAAAKASSILGGSASASAAFSKTVSLSETGLNISVDVNIIEGSEYVVPPGLTAVIRAGNHKEGALIWQKKNAFRPLSSTDFNFTRGEVDAIHDNDGPAIGVIHLTSSAKQLAATNLIKFRQTCGDSFVSTIRKGSGLQGVYVIDTTSNSEKVDLSAKAAGGWGGFSGSVSGQEEIQKLESESRLAIHYFQVGGSTTPIAINDQGFRDLIQKIGSTASLATSRPFSLGVTSYTSLPDFPVARTFSAMNLDAIGNQYYRLYSLDAQINYMLTHTNQYFFDKKVTTAGIASMQDAIKSDMHALLKALQACSSTPAKCSYPVNVVKDDYGYRQELPIVPAAVDDWVRLQALRSQLATAQTTLNVTPKFLVFNVPVRIQIPNPSYKPALNRVNSLTAQVNSLTAAADSSDNRYHIWIEYPARVRCENNERDQNVDIGVCLDNAQLDMIHAQMLK